MWYLTEIWPLTRCAHFAISDLHYKNYYNTASQLCNCCIAGVQVYRCTFTYDSLP